MKTPHRPSLADAVARYNADRATEVNLPRPGTGTCPVCKHHDCFGRLKGETTKWACWSTNHPPDAGKPSSRYVWGDLLDLDLLLAEIAPTPAARARWLRDRNYLPDGKRGARSLPRRVKSAIMIDQSDTTNSREIILMLFEIAKLNDIASVEALPTILRQLIKESIELTSIESKVICDFEQSLLMSIEDGFRKISAESKKARGT